MPRVIKRYDNRKLYDIEARRYVSLREIVDLVRAGESVTVQDNATGSDLTAPTLAKAVLEDQGSNSRVFAELLQAWLRSGEAGVKKASDWIIRHSLELVAPVTEMRREVEDLRAQVAALEKLLAELEKRKSK